ncbi:MAG: rRNA pseudouridine synthase, partial [Peptococcaceae bacterium]|nr:rRNA pseudouridine synthase [Peptococcaceae bacterium]
MAEERLQKYLAAAGVASRRASETLILEGRVAVNGKVVKELGTKVTPEKDKVTVDGKPVQTEEQLVYYLMNKPAGYLTTVKDTHDRPTVMDLLTGIPYRVFPVGRLDFETEGLLLLTNDGEFAYRMTHPKFKIKKTYLATV